MLVLAMAAVVEERVAMPRKHDFIVLVVSCMNPCFEIFSTIAFTAKIYLLIIHHSTFFLSHCFFCFSVLLRYTITTTN